jgi:hypothetical protein
MSSHLNHSRSASTHPHTSLQASPHRHRHRRRRCRCRSRGRPSNPALLRSLLKRRRNRKVRSPLLSLCLAPTTCCCCAMHCCPMLAIALLRSHIHPYDPHAVAVAHSLLHMPVKRSLINCVQTLKFALLPQSSKQPNRHRRDACILGAILGANGISHRSSRRWRD